MGKVRVAVVGLGSWGECHVETYAAMPEVEITAICDTREEVLERVGNKYGIKNRFSDSDQLWERDDIDLVNIVTYENAHCDPTIKALKSGKHVLVEKPVSTQLHEAKEMWEAAKSSGKFLVPGHVLRFDAQYAEVFETLRSEKIGKPVTMLLKRGRPRSLFKLYSRIHPVYESAVHDLDMAIWYSGSRVKSVRAYARSVTGAAVPDMLWSCLEFENGVIGIIESNWLISDQAAIGMTDAVEITAEKGSAGFETSRSGLQIWSEEGRFTPALNVHTNQNGRVFGALREQLTYLCSCILRNEEPSYVSFPDAIHGIEVAEAIIRSSETNQEIYL
ncbi:Gfo/Idh/MocA family protein [Paenibacillus eucommiae]|uniref:Dehydrogenase n=1 Tax=Paenibacillus eucommiae TaxID=1355755 RepID=A0ABS4J4S3_9BACL|nr:Gfo/Idh/MocA family oxidoreductase [Paenibacillus eucommiae]MBP1994838.1 putative dehydrogenase [Paenibacillus eucommiae]